MKGECEGCGAWDEVRPVAGRIFCACCRPGASLMERWEATRALREKFAALEAKASEAQENYEFMVQRAAEEKLDGYRELGQRAAGLETRAEAAESVVARMKAEARSIYRRWSGEDHARAEGFSTAAAWILEAGGEKP